MTTKQPSSPYLMVFCLFLFTLSIGAFDRFSPIAEEALEAESSLAAELKESIVVPLGDDEVVDIQQILQRHALLTKPTEVEEVAVSEELAIPILVDAVEQLAAEAGVESVITTPGVLVTEDIEKVLIDSLLEIGSVVVEAATASRFVGNEDAAKVLGGRYADTKASGSPECYDSSGSFG
ncbi:MAG: hypothetical protein ACJZ8Y_02690 [Pirellulaceae bacterium]